MLSSDVYYLNNKCLIISELYITPINQLNEHSLPLISRQGLYPLHFKPQGSGRNAIV